MNKSLKAFVRLRATDRCEYCQLPQSVASIRHGVDHIRAKKHRGKSDRSNTCLACAQCNTFKGSDVTGYDPVSDQLVLLFNPRTDDWTDHFQWNGPILNGLTPIGRATIEVLKINLTVRIELRESLS